MKTKWKPFYRRSEKLGGGVQIWVCENARILKNSVVSDNSVVANSALVSGKFLDKNVVIGGNPARIIKRNVDWSCHVPAYLHKPIEESLKCYREENEMKEHVILYGINDVKLLQKINTVAEVSYLTGFDENKYNTYIWGYEYISTNRRELKEQTVIVCVEKLQERISIIGKLKAKGICAVSLDEYVLKKAPKKEISIHQREFYIYGNLNDCRRLDEILSSIRGVNVLGYATHEIKNIGKDKITGRNVDSLHKVQKKVLSENGGIGLIAVFEEYGFDLVLQFVDKEIRDKDYFYICSASIKKTFWSAEDLNKIFVPYKKSKRQSNIQFMITKYCNLNCKLCSHFSPLDGKKTIYDFKQYCEDTRRVSELLDVDLVGLWGGEALLCPNLHEYIYQAREAFPESRLMIGSNGLLITKMNDELVEAIKATDTTVSISLYPPTLNMIEEIKEFLDKKGIRQRYPQNTRITRFGRKYDTTGTNTIEDAWKWCGEKQCSSVFEGKIATCYFPLLAHLYNDEFGKTFYTDNDIIDLYDKTLTSEVLVDKLRNPIESCKYCSDMKWEEWSPIGLNSKREDWIL